MSGVKQYGQQRFIIYVSFVIVGVVTDQKMKMTESAVLKVVIMGDDDGVMIILLYWRGNQG